MLPDFPSSTVIYLSMLLEAGSTTVMGFNDIKNLRLLQKHLKCSGVSRTSPTESRKRKMKERWITNSRNVEKKLRLEHIVIRVQVLVLYTSILLTALFRTYLMSSGWEYLKGKGTGDRLKVIISTIFIVDK